MKILGYNKRLFIGVITVVVLIASLPMLLTAYENNRIQHAKNAVPIGVTYAKEKCLDEGLGSDICNTVTGAYGSIDDEYMGKPAIFVYVKASDQYVFSASCVVQDNGLGHPMVVAYTRDTSTGN